jgi:hypothetical protein
MTKAERVVGIRPTSESGMNPKDIYGLAKVPLSLNSIPGQILMAMGKKIGAIKYGEYNYRVAKVQGRVYLEALQRHTGLLLDGEDFDRDTGYPHICFILACADIVADAWVNGFLIDTRPLPSRAGELMALLNEKPGEAPRTPDQIMDLFRGFINSERDTTYMMEHVGERGTAANQAPDVDTELFIAVPPKPARKKSVKKSGGRRARR